MDPYPRGPDWMPITPKTGSLFHAESHHVETDDIIKLGGEVGIVGSLEGPDPVRLELMGGPCVSGGAILPTYDI